MISRAHPFLGWALVISIVLHAMLIVAPAWRGTPQAQVPLTVSLREHACRPGAAAYRLAQPPVLDSA